VAFSHAFFIATGLLMEGIIAHFTPSTMAATVVKRKGKERKGRVFI